MGSWGFAGLWDFSRVYGSTGLGVWESPDCWTIGCGVILLYSMVWLVHGWHCIENLKFHFHIEFYAP